MLSGKTLIYIAAELAVEMFFRKIGRVTSEGDGKCSQKQLERRIFQGFNRSTRGLTWCY
jgi:hypothetical protein